MRKIGAGLGTLGAKIGPKMLSIGLKLAKFAKIGKFGLAVGSAVSYAYLFTWKFSLMVMVLLFVHESGHLWAMKRCGIPTKGIYFIPFLGAAAVADDTFKSRRDETYIAIMGPIWGFILSGFVAILYLKTGNTLFGAAAGWMAMINLFNLLPINPLDGGRIMKSIIFSINSRLGLLFMIIGIITSIILTFWAGIILFFVLLIIGSAEFLAEYYGRYPNRIIKKCVKDIDEILEDDPPEKIKESAEKLKNMLIDDKEDSSTKIKKAIYYGNNTSDLFLKSIISRKLKMFDPMPKMSKKGIILSIISYIVTAVVLWGLMTYMNHIPEVEIARKLFMS